MVDFVTFPVVPQLIGEDNLADWKLAVLQNAEYHDFSHFFERNVLEPPAAAAADVKVEFRR